MNELLGSVKVVFDKLSVLSTSACGGCHKDCTRQQDAGLANVFALHPLRDGDLDAVRATQRGVRLLHEGKVEESLRELHDARQLAPRSHEACSNLACAYHMSGDDNTALYWYREAYRLAPRDETAVLALALLEQRRGQVEEANRMLVLFLQEADPSHVGALKQLGRLHQHEEQYSKAAGCFHRLIAIDPTNNEWPAQLQLCLDQLPVKDDWGNPVRNPAGLPGMFARAFSFAEPILRNAVPLDAKEALSMTASRAGRSSGLSTPSTTSSSMAGGGPGRGSFPAQGPGISGFAQERTRASFAPLQDGFGSPRGNQESAMGVGTAVAVQLQEARRQRDSGRADAALGVYRGLLRLDCRNAEALAGFADCQYELGNFDAALEAGKQLLGLKPDDAEANLRVAELLLGAGHDPDMAEPYLKRAGASGGRALQHRLLCASSEAALAREDHAKALAGASEAVRLDASAPRGLFLLGSARIKVAEYPAAIRALSAALEACESAGESRRLRASIHALAAQAHERMRQYPQALTHVQQALDIAPEITAPRVIRAMALHQSGQSREAVAELEAVLQHTPDSAAARLQLGYCQLSGGDATKAAASLEAVVTGSGASRSHLGAAKVYLSLALDLLPDRSGCQRHADLVVKEGLSLHRNLQCVWKEIEGGLASQPMAAVQRLRGICDLDLTSVQAKQLLALLARAAGRTDFSRSFAGLEPPQSRGGSGAASRQPSVPPNRWAPSGDDNMRVASSGTSTPMGGRRPSMQSSPWQWQGGGDACRGRSGSPMSRGGGGPSYGGYPDGPSPGPGAVRGRGGGGPRGSSPIPSASEPLTIGWNELIRREQLVFGPQLGAGGSAQVYRGSWNGQEVAIKKISGVAHLEEMKKEINALRRLRHPRLVRFCGACVEPPLLLVVTEFMSGGSLHDRLFGSRQNPPLVPMQKWTISCHMAEGINFLHTQRVVHRDLKSMNILLDSQQNAKICDFGLAQQMECTHIARKLDGEGGSPRYMAPECYDAAHGKITEKVDIWAMGCILIELFSGSLPYADCSTMAQLSARILVERRPPDVPPMVPVPVAGLIRCCLNFDANRRIGASDLQNELAKMQPR